MIDENPFTVTAEESPVVESTPLSDKGSSEMILISDDSLELKIEHPQRAENQTNLKTMKETTLSGKKVRRKDDDLVIENMHNR